MATIAGIQIPDDVYQSLLNAVQTEINMLKSNPAIALFCLSPGNLLICYDVALAMNIAVQKVQNVIQNAYQQLLQIEQQAKAQGEKLTQATMYVYGTNILPSFIKNIPVIGSWTYQQITNLELNALKAAVATFNSDTLPKVNNYLQQNGWQLKPLSVSYDSSKNAFVIQATYVELGSPEPFPWSIVIIIAILAVITFAIYVYWQTQIINYKIQQLKQQTTQIVAQNVSQLLQDCIQVTNNVAQCNQLVQSYLNGIQQLQYTLGGGQPPFQSTLQFVEDLAIIAVVAGLVIVILSNLKK